jgi:hypothetical protein
LRTANAKSICLKVTPLGIAAAEKVFELLPYTRKPCLRSTAAQSDQSCGDAVCDRVGLGTEIVLGDRGSHAPETGVRSTVLACRERCTCVQAQGAGQAEGASADGAV